MTRFRSVALAFLVLLAVFAITHIVDFPGSLAHLMHVNGGRKILDMQPSFSSAETYQRLEAMGAIGREAYLRMILTIDIVFPLSVFAFLFLLARFVARKIAAAPALAKLLVAVPVVYLVLDFCENVFVLLMLARYPERLDLFGTSIGYFTVGKRIAMLVAMFLPLLLWLLVKAVAKVHRRQSAA